MSGQGKVSAETFEYSAGQKAVRITAESPKGAKSVAEIAYFGAHVLNFDQVSAEGKVTPLLWTTKKAILDGSSAIRGGIPVIFPQFNAFGSMKSHGFARISVWELKGISSDLPKGTTTATFRLTPNELSKKMWGEEKSFIYDYAVTVEAPTETKPGLMKIESTVSNTGKEVFGFTCALHTYFPVSDITQAAVSSVAPLTVQGTKYIDQLMEGKERGDKICTEKNNEILFDKETDRIYLDVPKFLQVVDKKSGLKIIQETDFGDTVVWNPWIEKSKRMSKKDFDENEYKEMVCVEVAEVGTKGDKISMKPGEVFKRTVSFTSSALIRINEITHMFPKRKAIQNVVALLALEHLVKPQEALPDM
eukprot:CAMPEP_0114504928 /NCGR_PEP_ID=MMETSP0109-20121206/10556_1 /TAXON_ID=29199 /ORGANISM="Chlorarachnion reptans, Strain CCCM449" /LENGTH=361 /DNA_ID=CAMNT_0001683283 /DNA_START=221 /DNA_END=1305 /DNA_ORIENTATION=-